MAASALLMRPSGCSLLRPAASQRVVVRPFCSLAPRVAPQTAGLRQQQTALVAGAPCQRRGASLVVRASSDDEKKYNTEFGYSRKDVILIGVGLIVLGYVLYYGLQAMGMDAGIAGNWVQLIIFMGICVGWVSTYLFRVATKQMTYVKQLEAYEEAVMKKRIEEMTESELAELAEEVEKDKVRKAQMRAQMQQQKQQQQQ